MKGIQYQNIHTNLIQRTLSRKYSNSDNTNSCSLVSSHVINRLVKPQNYLNTQKITYDELSYFLSQKQYLKRFYKSEEYFNKNKALCEYYKFHEDYPYSNDAKISIIMIEHQQQRNKQKRKMIKRLMNEPESVTELTESSASRTNQPRQKSFSMQLKYLNEQRSSLWYEEVCENIGKAFQHLKPIYFYKSQPDQHLQQFIKFLNEHDRDLQENWIHQQKDLEEANIQNCAKLQNMYPSRKFDSGKQFRRTFIAIGQKGISKKPETKRPISRGQRNKTTLVKPQSFSKTTVNETISKCDHLDLVNKKKLAPSIRIKKCKSKSRPFSSDLTKTKSFGNIMKINELEEKNNRNKENQQKINRISSINRLSMKNKTIRQKSKRELTNKFEKTQNIQKPQILRSLSKKVVKKTLIRQKQQIKPQNNEIPKCLNNLIKTKLKLRA